MLSKQKGVEVKKGFLASKLYTKSIIFSIILLFFTGCDYDVTSNIDNDTNITNNKQKIEFSVLHSSSEDNVDFDARVLTVNSVDRTVDTTITSVPQQGDINTTLTYIPADEFTLPEGNVTITVVIPYKNKRWWYFSDNALEDEIHFYVDSVAPTIIAKSPENNSQILDALTDLSYEIYDNGSGLNQNSIKIIVNGQDETSQSVFKNGILTYTPTNNSPLPASSFNANIEASDNLGNEQNATFSYIVQPKVVLGAFPRAVPQTAAPGETIRFYPVVTTDTAIQRYDWDLDGDGTFERGDLVGNTYTYKYAKSGDYNVSLKVIDTNGKVFIGSTIVHIQNLPPQVNAEATPSNGPVPLKVSFSVTASDNEGIARYEWDFNGDGIYDYNSTETGNTIHTYTKIGEFSPTIKVTDTQNVSTTYTLPTTTVNVAVEGSPSITGSSNIYSGKAPLTVSLSATATDPQGKGFSLWEWDFNGDGIYDYESNQSASVTHTFTAAGSYFPRVRVTTLDGRQSTDIIEIDVLNMLSLSVNKDTIDTILGESATITTKIAADTKIKLVIENRNNQVVRTLVDWSQRKAGTYNDIWNGFDDNGNKVAESDYYAVLLYKNNEEQKKLDLRDSTGGVQFNPSRNNAARNIAPFDNKPMNITFHLNRAAEVTAFMGYSYSNTRVVTFYSRQPMGKGDHNLKWYATNNEGILIKAPPGKYFLYGNWAYTLADNAIYVKSGAHITDVSVKPVIFNPTSHKEDGLKSTANISFNLTSDASVELTVVDAQTGVLMAYKKYDNLLEGANTIEWDGRNSADEFIAPGKYRIALRAVDATGYSSLLQYSLLRIYY